VSSAEFFGTAKGLLADALDVMTLPEKLSSALTPPVGTITPAGNISPFFQRILRWAPAIIVVIVAAALRLTDLGHVPQLLFDESWYVPDAYALAHYGYEVNWSDTLGPGSTFDPAVQIPLIHGAQQATHAPLGKWLIWIGMAIFGPANPIGWRFSAAIFGTILVALTIIVTHELLKTRRHASYWAAGAGLLIACDPYAVAMSRLAVLDIFLAVFVLAGTWMVLKDRTQNRTRTRVQVLRPWLWSAAVLFGAAAAVKLSGLFFFAGFALYLTVATILAAVRDRTGWRTPTLQILYDGITSMVLLTAAYIASWSGWLASHAGYDRTWATTHPASGLAALIPDWARSLWEYQSTKIHEVSGITAAQYLAQNGYPDTNASPAWTWLFGDHPVVVSGLIHGTGAAQTLSTVQTVPNLLVWWAGLAAIIAALVTVVRRPVTRYVLPLVGVAAGWVPWFFAGDRLVYQTYVIAFLPFLAILVTVSVTSVKDILADKGDIRWLPSVLVGVFFAAATLLGLWLMPLATGSPLPVHDFHAHLLMHDWAFPSAAPIHS
jgi:dolichyl-phosphate-mannose-protein mannosyltransferase